LTKRLQIPSSPVKEEAFELFLTPFERAFFNRANVRLKVGGGLYYAYNTLTVKGFLDIPALETLGKERVNSFSNDSTTHSAGLNITLGFNYQAEWLDLTVNGGMVPIFYMSARQDMKVTPLMDPHNANCSQATFGVLFLRGHCRYAVQVRDPRAVI
jgi:hypothetical protein